MERRYNQSPQEQELIDRLKKGDFSLQQKLRVIHIIQKLRELNTIEMGYRKEVRQVYKKFNEDKSNAKYFLDGYPEFQDLLFQDVLGETSFRNKFDQASMFDLIENVSFWSKYDHQSNSFYHSLILKLKSSNPPNNNGNDEEGAREPSRYDIKKFILTIETDENGTPIRTYATPENIFAWQVNLEKNDPNEQSLVILI